jgi:hypothetical protein
MAATLDKDLTSTLKAARGGRPMRFAFLPKGSEGKLLVAKKVPPQEIAETKKEIGASAVFKGRCVGEGGTLVFYVAKEPPGTLLGQLRKRLKEDAGVTYPIEIRVSSDAEAEPADGEAAAAGAAAAPGTSGGPRAAWEKALAAVEPAYVRGLRDQPDKASALRAVMGFAQGKATKEDFAGAIVALRKLAEQLAKTPANGAKTAPGPEPVSPAGVDLAAQWKAKLAEYTPALKAALAAKGPNAAAIAKLLAQATALSKPGGDMVQALAKLTECHKLATGPAPTSPGGADLTAQWKARLAEYTPALKAALAAKGPDAAAIGKLLAQANALAKPGGDMAQALAKLKECHALAAASPAAAEAKVPGAESKPADQPQTQTVSDEVFENASRLWESTRQQLQTDLVALEKKILDDCAAINANKESDIEIDMEELEVKVTTLHDVLTHLDDRLLHTLHDALEADVPERRKKNQKEAARLVKGYLKFVNSDPTMAQIDQNGFADFKIRQRVTSALNDLAKTL